MYASDHGGRYPEKLSDITPLYLKTIPTCPVAGKDTYSPSYRSTKDPDYFLVFCSGSYHQGSCPPNFPQYDSVAGLIEGGGGSAAGSAAGTGSPADKKPAPLTIAGIKVRQFFPETLYWNPLVVTDESGNASVDLEMADSITTWRLSGLANTRRGVTGSFTKPIRSFQEFFIDPDLPEHLTRGDSITLPIALYNYLPTAQSLEVSLLNDRWFDVTGPTVKRVALKANDVSSVSFTITVKEVGDYRFTVLARSDSQKDAVSKSIRVDPDGKEVQVVSNGTLDKTVHCTVPIPSGSVPGGSTILVKIYPGVTTQMVDGLDGMLRMPYG
ncbi:MAG: alpha-2-macroglobulin family protein [Candidatus Xenobiia bacterium LiM19]